MKLKKLMSALVSVSIISAVAVSPVSAEKISDKLVFSQDFNSTIIANPDDYYWTNDATINDSLDGNTNNFFRIWKASSVPADGNNGQDGTKALYLNQRKGGSYYYLENDTYTRWDSNSTADWTSIDIPYVKTTASALTTGYYITTFDYYPSIGYEIFYISGSPTFENTWTSSNSDVAFNGNNSSLSRTWYKVTITEDLDNKVIWVSIRNVNTDEEAYATHWNYTKGLGKLKILTDHGSQTATEFSKPQNSAIIDNIQIVKRETVPDPSVKIINANNGIENDLSNVSNRIKKIEVDFGTDIDESTLTSATVSLNEETAEGTVVVCNRNYVDNMYTITPLTDLKEETDYVFTISGVKYADGEPVNTVSKKLTTKYNDVINEVISFSQDFESITNSVLGSWRNAYNIHGNGSFRIYSTSPTTNNCLYDYSENYGMYLAVKSSSKDSSAMQLAVANDDESSLASGRYKLRYDFYPANGKNTLTLVKFSDVNEAMATYTGGSSLMKDEIFSSREWYNAEIEVDLEKDKASLVISKKTDGTVVYSNEIPYSDDLNVFNFYMSGTNVCTTANSAIFDNISFYEVISVPEMKISVIDGMGNIQTDLTQSFAGVSSIEMDFGMEVAENTLNNDSIFLLDKNNDKVQIQGKLDGNVYRIAPVYELDDFAEYKLVLNGDAKYLISETEQKASRKQKITINTGDSRPDPKVSVIGGDDKEVFITTNLLCAVKEIKIDFQKSVQEDTLSDSTVILKEKQSGNVVECDRTYNNGVYTLTPNKLSEGVAYDLLIKSDIKYESGKSLREYTQEISVFSGLVNYYQDFENASEYEGWSSSNIFEVYEQSPVIRYYGSELKSGLGYDGSTAFVLCTTDNPNSPIVNRDMEIPFGKNLKTMGVYQVICDYYPSAGLDCVNLRGNHKFAAGYGVVDGMQLFSSDIEDREWMTLTVTIDLDNKSAEYSIISKATGETIKNGSETFRNSLGLIEFYMQEDADTKGKIWMQENSMILDNIKITRLPYESAPTINESQLEFCIDDVIQADIKNISILTNNINIVPTQEILMSSITRDNIYLLKEDSSDKLYCTMTYKDGVISIKPDSILDSESKYILCIQSLENPDGYSMEGSGFKKGFKTAKKVLVTNIGAVDESSWTIKKIKNAGKVEVGYNAFNSTQDNETLHFVISYFNEDYSKLLKVEEQKVDVAANTTKADNIVFNFSPSFDFAHIQVTLLNSLSKMNVSSVVKEPN